MSDVIPCSNPEGCYWPACPLDCKWRPGIRYHPDLLEATINKLVERDAELVAALERIAKLEDIQSESGRVACKALASLDCK